VYRVAFIFLMALAVALGLVVGTLNSDPATLDLLWFQIDWPLGLIVLCAVAVGLLLGLTLSWLFGILPLRSRLRRAVRGERGPGSSAALTKPND
jgi:uncharacterized integral membrane protein